MYTRVQKMVLESVIVYLKIIFKKTFFKQVPTRFPRNHKTKTADITIIGSTIGRVNRTSLSYVYHRL